MTPESNYCSSLPETSSLLSGSRLETTDEVTNFQGRPAPKMLTSQPSMVPQPHFSHTMYERRLSWLVSTVHMYSYPRTSYSVPTTFIPLYVSYKISN